MTQIHRNQKYYDFLRHIGESRIAGAKQINEFGRNEDIGTSAVTLMDADQLYYWLGSAQQLDIVSDDAADDAGDTGAQEVYLCGLDSNYEIIEETLELNGTCIVTTTNSYLRVNCFECTQAGSDGTNQGTITLQDQSSSPNIINTIEPEIAKAHASVFTVPANWVGYLVGWHGAERSRKGVTFEVWVREIDNSIWKIRRETALLGTEFDRIFPLPIKVGGKADIEIRVIAEKDGSYGTGGFQGYMINNNVHKYY